MGRTNSRHRPIDGTQSRLSHSRMPIDTMAVESRPDNVMPDLVNERSTMLSVPGSDPTTFCDRVSRRDALRIGAGDDGTVAANLARGSGSGRSGAEPGVQFRQGEARHPAVHVGRAGPSGYVGPQARRPAGTPRRISPHRHERSRHSHFRAFSAHREARRQTRLDSLGGAGRQQPFHRRPRRTDRAEAQPESRKLQRQRNRLPALRVRAVETAAQHQRAAHVRRAAGHYRHDGGQGDAGTGGRHPRPEVRSVPDHRPSRRTGFLDFDAATSRGADESAAAKPPATAAEFRRRRETRRAFARSRRDGRFLPAGAGHDPRAGGPQGVRHRIGFRRRTLAVRLAHLRAERADGAAADRSRGETRHGLLASRGENDRHVVGHAFPQLYRIAARG